jgi:hypothetical protein
VFIAIFDYFKNVGYDCDINHVSLQVRVRGLASTTTKTDVFHFRHCHHADAVTIHGKGKKHKYAYIKFKTSEEAKEFVQSAGTNGREHSLNKDGSLTEVTFRPLLGFNRFNQERPYYVLPVCRHTCVCQKCHSMRLLFTALLGYDWESVAPRVHSLLADARECAGLLSPTMDNILDVVLCQRDPETDFFKLACCSGDCPHYRSNRHFHLHKAYSNGNPYPTLDPHS